MACLRPNWPVNRDGTRVLFDYVSKGYSAHPPVRRSVTHSRGFGLVLLTAIVFDAWLRPFNLWRLVTGDFYIDRRTYLLSGHFPLLGTLASLSAAALMLLASVRVIQRREF